LYDVTKRKVICIYEVFKNVHKSLVQVLQGE